MNDDENILEPVTLPIAKMLNKNTGKMSYFRLVDHVKPKLRGKDTYERVLIQYIRIVDLQGNDIDFDDTKEDYKVAATQPRQNTDAVQLFDDSAAVSKRKPNEVSIS